MSNITFSPQNIQIMHNFRFSPFVTKLHQMVPNPHYPMISTMPFHSKSSKESKSTLGSSKNLAKLSKSTKNNSDQNTLRQKLVQKSLFKFLSCSSYSTHQNPIKIEPKTMKKCSQNLHLCSVENIENAQK